VGGRSSPRPSLNGGRRISSMHCSSKARAGGKAELNSQRRRGIAGLSMVPAEGKLMIYARPPRAFEVCWEVRGPVRQFPPLTGELTKELKKRKTRCHHGELDLSELRPAAAIRPRVAERIHVAPQSSAGPSHNWHGGKHDRPLHRAEYLLAYRRQHYVAPATLSWQPAHCRHEKVVRRSMRRLRGAIPGRRPAWFRPVYTSEKRTLHPAHRRNKRNCQMAWVVRVVRTPIHAGIPLRFQSILGRT